MKIRIYCIILIVLLSFRVLLPCQPPQPGTPVWDIAAENVLLTHNIESTLDSIHLKIRTNFFDRLLVLVNEAESKANTLLADLNQLQSQVQSDVVTTQAIESRSEQIERFFATNELSAWDIAAVFTALDGLEQNIVTQLDALNADLTTISDNLEQLITTDVMHNLTITSQFERLSGDVVQLQSMLEVIDVTQQSDFSDSMVDLIAENISIVANDLTQLQTQLAVEFQGTFSALEVNLGLAQQFDSLVDVLPVSSNDNLEMVYNALDELELSVDTISSQVDILSTNVVNIMSTIDQFSSKVNQVSSQFDNVENWFAHVSSSLEILVDEQRLSFIEEMVLMLKDDNSLLDHMLDEPLYALSATISSKLSVIDDEIVDQNSKLDLLSHDLVSASISIVDQAINDSRLEVVNSKIDVQMQEVFSIESLINIIDINVHDAYPLDHALSDVQSINSIIDWLPALPIMSSRLEEIDQELLTINSLVDVITPQIQTEFSYASNIQNTLDHITINTSSSDAALLIVPQIVTTVANIESKVDLYTQLISNMQEEAQELVVDMQSAWTVLSVIEDNASTSIDILSDTTELLQDDIDAALSISEIFTVIDSIIAQEDTVNVQVDTYTSLVSALNTDLATDFGGIFTALTDIYDSTAAHVLTAVSDKLSHIQSILGIPIYQRDIPLTITTPGRYYFAENIDYSGILNAISINANNVSIDLDSRVLRYTGVGSASGFSIANGISNVSIFNGTIVGFNNYNINTQGLGAISNIRVYNIISIATQAVNTGMRLFNVRNLFVHNCDFYNGRGFLLIANSDNACVHNCLFRNHGGVELGGVINNLVVSNCTYQQKNAEGTNNCIGLSTGSFANVVMQKCFANFYDFGANTGTANTVGYIALNNTLVGLTDVGFLMQGSAGVIKHNSIVKCNVGIANLATNMSDYFIGFNTLIENSLSNIVITLGRNTLLGNFAINNSATGSPDNTNYNLFGSTTNINGKFVTASQSGSFIGVPTYWHNINMLP